MASITNEYSQFPNKVMERHYFKDVDDSIAPLIIQIKELQAQGDYDRVNQIIAKNMENLAQYTLSAEYINLIDEEIRNLQIYAKSNKQSFYVGEEEPDDIEALDVWIGD
jgi:hypothetical protein